MYNYLQSHKNEYNYCYAVVASMYVSYPFLFLSTERGKKEKNGVVVYCEIIFSYLYFWSKNIQVSAQLLWNFYSIPHISFLNPLLKISRNSPVISRIVSDIIL